MLCVCICLGVGVKMCILTRPPDEGFRFRFVPVHRPSQVFFMVLYSWAKSAVQKYL